MSFGTTYFSPSTMGRDMDFTNPGPRQGFHQRSCSGGAYSEDLFLVSKLASDPRDFYVDEAKEGLDSPESGAYLHVDHQMGGRAGPGAKQPRDRMRLQRILNGSEEGLQQQQQQQQQQPQHQQHQQAQDVPTDQYQSYPYHDGTPTMVTTALPTTLATMSSPMSPLTSFSTMSQPNLIFEDVMPYPYTIQQYPHQSYPFKHAGNAKPLDQSFVPDNTQGHAPHYHSPDPSGSPSVLSSFPQRPLSSLVDHQYPAPDSPPFYGQNQATSPYSVGSHSPISNGSYTSAHMAPGTPGSNSFTPTPPATPHYGYPTDGRYSNPTPVYGDHFTLQSQAGPRAHRYIGSPSTPPTPTSISAPTFRQRKTPYEHRNGGSQLNRSHEHSPTGTTPAPRRFQCHECEKAFPTKGELASHARCHLKVPAFLCGICGRPFKRRTDYVRHVRNVHEEVGRYGCAQCGERFGRLDKLKRHDKRGCGADKEDGEK